MRRATLENSHQYLMQRIGNGGMLGVSGQPEQLLKVEVTILFLYFLPRKGCLLHLLPARASEQGNVIGLVSIYMSSKKICN